MSRSSYNPNPGLVPEKLHGEAIDQAALHQNTFIQGDRNRMARTPYLGLQARLSQIWFNRWTVLLLLILVRVLIMLSSLNDNLGDAKVKALAACTKVEDIGSAMASMPHYLSVGVNELTASGITHAVSGMVTILEMILTGVEELILFVINMMTSTYTCLIAAAVHGGLNVSALVVTKTTDAMNDVIHGLAGDIGTITSGVQKTINDVYDKIDSAGSLFGIDLPDKPTIDITSDLDKLNNVKINTDGFVADLDNLNKELPTFEDVQNFTRNAVSIPFDLVKTALNDSYGDWKFDDSIFPTAKKEALSFCSDNSVIVDFFDHLFKIAADAKIAFIVVLSLLAVAACVPLGYWEIRRWRHQRAYRTLFQENKYDDFDLMLMGARPLTSKIGLKLANWFAGSKNSPKYADRYMMIRWGVAYGTSLPAIFVLSLAIAGFFSCLCQYIILAAVQKEVPALANQVGDFANEVVNTLENVSVNWANDANGVITGFSDEVNHDVLGYVVNATDAVNDTLNTFTKYMDEGLTVAFNNTLLMDPISEVVNCLIGLKIAAVQSGLTWVHDHAKVSLPLFPNDTFSAGAAKSIDGDSDLTSFLSSPSSVTTDEVTGAVTHVTDALHNNIVQEALISTGLLLVYVLVVLIGVVRTLSAMAFAKGSGYNGANNRDPANILTQRTRFARSASVGPGTRSRDADPFDDHNSLQMRTYSTKGSPRSSFERQHPYHAQTYGEKQ